MDIIDDEIEELRTKIERLAPSDSEERESREELYKTLEKVSKDEQKAILLAIFSCQISSDLIPQTEKAQKKQREIEKLEKEEAKEREKARKKYEYIQRCLAKGKIPKVEPPDPMLLVPERPPHRKKDIFLLCLWDLYVVLKRTDLSPIYENLRRILRGFLNVFITLNSIKRELSRLKNAPSYRSHIQEYIEFKGRLKTPAKKKLDPHIS